MLRVARLLLIALLAAVPVLIAGAFAVHSAVDRPLAAMFTSETEEAHDAELLIVARWWLVASGLAAVYTLLFGLTLRFRRAVVNDALRARSTVLFLAGVLLGSWALYRFAWRSQSHDVADPLRPPVALFVAPPASALLACALLLRSSRVTA